MGDAGSVFDGRTPEEVYSERQKRWQHENLHGIPPNKRRQAVQRLGTTSEQGADPLTKAGSERPNSSGGQTMNDQPDTTTWPDFAIVLFDLLTGRKAEITYQFDNLEIFVPIASGPEPEHAIWKINGAVKVRAREEVQG